jgi:hypothetical protein
MFRKPDWISGRERKIIFLKKSRQKDSFDGKRKGRTKNPPRP